MDKWTDMLDPPDLFQMLNPVTCIRDRDSNLVGLRNGPSNHLQEELWQEGKAGKYGIASI